MAKFVSASDENSGKNRQDPFSLGGFLMPEADWLGFFAPAWQERVLDGPPAIPYLHMTSIRSRAWRDQYGISKIQAESRLDEAFCVIDSMGTLYPLMWTANGNHVRKAFPDDKITFAKGGKRPMEPDYICFLAYAFTVLHYLDHFHPEAKKVDFIVEKNGNITNHITEFHAQLSGALNALGLGRLSPLIGELIPGGKNLIPLQAADLLCWYTARYRNEGFDVLDRNRYAKLAIRKGFRNQWSNRQLLDLATTLHLAEP